MNMKANIAEAALTAEDERDINPDVRQRRASDPSRSVWVGASAGTGKTKVLTDRVLRLLLPRPDGKQGSPPHRILCLTFTKAAASEMLQRIGRILGRWAVMEDADLAEDLRRLTGGAPTKEEMTAARKLFASVIDAPGGMKIMTIHSFCQSVLGRFPLEANLPTNFAVVDELQARALQATARDAALLKAKNDPDSPLGQAVGAIAAQINEEQFAVLLASLSSERLQLETVLGEDPYEQAFAAFGLAPEETEERILRDACTDGSFNREALFSACRALAQGSDADRARGVSIQLWLEAAPDQRVSQIAAYEKIFLTAEGALRKKMATKAAVSAMPDVEEILNAEGERIRAFRERMKDSACAFLTGSLLFLGREIAAAYQDLKSARALLDYDDLILRTLSLLENAAMAPWVLYKLDGGLDHILIDEAQDTNPEQWKIIGRLCEDFFSGAGAREEIERTVFTVGDEKQSIYSFQRASPAEFERMRAHFAAKTDIREEKLAISFRSVKSVLALVDEVFAPPAMRQGMGEAAVSHRSHRRGQGGLVEIWPLCESDPAPQEEPWTPPVSITEIPSGQAKLAARIGDTIREWLEKGERIESLDRALRAGDIMILVKTRTAFVGHMIRALKTRGIPVSGADRMILGGQIAVMDILALAQFALLPDDDLTLACVLKSPLIGFDEETLYELAADRPGALWQALRQSRHGEIVRWLKARIEQARCEHPYEFFAGILHSPCPADSVSGLRAMLKRLGEDARDPLDELLNAALFYEQNGIPALQGFLAAQKQGDITIKREMEEAGNAVRIMTVHGAKGLQAPVVFLPDTVHGAAARKSDNLLWPDKTGLGIPLWSPRADDFPALYRQARGRCEAYLEEEYKRLLYVAMTRAEDRLYVCGYKNRKEAGADCWYGFLDSAFSRLENVEEKEGGTRRLSNPQIAAPSGDGEKSAGGGSGIAPPPRWLFEKAPAEPSPPRPLIPSRLDDDCDADAREAAPVRSPLDEKEAYRFRRGNVTHKLLQFLPELPPEERRRAAELFVARPGHRLPAHLHAEIVSETMAILEDPAYAPLFGSGSLAEAPVSGLVDGRIVNARIDRILVEERCVWIVDYKTNRPPPRDEKDIPSLYRRQMESYRSLIGALYSGRAVRCFLLWTDGPVLMELSAPFRGTPFGGSGFV